MPRAYSVDLRERSLRAVASGMPVVEVARIFGVSRSSLSRWQSRVRSGVALTPGHSPGRPRTVPVAQEDAVRAQVATQRDATLAEHCAQWAITHGVSVSPTTMGRLLARLGLPLKKRR